MDINGFKGSFDKLWGYANVVKYGVPCVNDNGCIVLVSGSPARQPKPGQIALSCVGGAVEAFTKMLASEIAPKRINVVSPNHRHADGVSVMTFRQYSNVTKTHHKRQALDEVARNTRLKMISFPVPPLMLMVVG